MKPQAINPAIACPNPHQQARAVRTHCLVDGRYSKNTAVSKIRLPPPPKPINATKNPSDGQLGMAPATIVAIEHIKSEMLKAHRRPIMSAPKPQKRAPASKPAGKHNYRLAEFRSTVIGGGGALIHTKDHCNL
jgi:hypothetical protein